VVRDRLKGRVHHDLRRWVELHSGSTQAAMIDLHVRHALRFVSELRDTHGIAEAIEIYRELVDVPSNMADAVYIYSLDRLASEELPKVAANTRADAEQVNLFPQHRRRTKRVV
jgi:hypothetical protein